VGEVVDRGVFPGRMSVSYGWQRASSKFVAFFPN
jgi:hypothetical protein